MKPEDYKTISGALEGLLFLENNRHNAGTQLYEQMLVAARKDAELALEALKKYHPA